MSLTEHLLNKKVIELNDLFSNETAFKLYEDMTDNAVFLASQVSDTRGDIADTQDTAHAYQTHSGRISETAWYTTFTKKSQDLLDEIRDTVAELLNVNVDQFEPWQCTRYFTGGKFDWHDDCGNWGSNERLYTVMYTIRAADIGGQTVFRKLGITLPSESNKLLIWRNLNEDYLCDGMAEHSGAPVGVKGQEDEKMIVVTWIRRFKYVS